jgi:hypothetical protein
MVNGGRDAKGSLSVSPKVQRRRKKGFERHWVKAGILRM